MMSKTINHIFFYIHSNFMRFHKNYNSQHKSKLMTQIKDYLPLVQRKSQKESKSGFLKLLADSVASNKATIQLLERKFKKQNIFSQKNQASSGQIEFLQKSPQKVDAHRLGSYDNKSGTKNFKQIMQDLNIYQPQYDDDTFSSYSGKSSKFSLDPIEVPELSQLKSSESCQSISQSQIKKRNCVYSKYFNDQYYRQQESPSQQQIQDKITLGTFTKKNQFSDTTSTIHTITDIKHLMNTGIKPAGIQDFKLGKRIGSGKFGQVYAAQHIKTGMVVALKLIKKTQIDEKCLIQLIREIKIQSFLNHSNIAKLYAFFDDRDHIYLVMEYCTSGDMYSFLKKHKRLQQKLVKSFIKQVCSAIQFLHQNNIIHRDLKPENILLQHKIIKICDFGWAVSSKVNRQTFCGTPIYVSPQLLKRSDYDSKIDIWSIGILMYQLLYGKVPFEIYTEGDLIKIIQDDIYFSKKIVISDQAKRFISNCLQKDPRQRFSIPQLLLDDFLKNQKHHISNNTE